MTDKSVECSSTDLLLYTAISPNFCSRRVEQCHLFNFLIQFNFNMNGANIKIIEIQFKYIDIQ